MRDLQKRLLLSTTHSHARRVPGASAVPVLAASMLFGPPADTRAQQLVWVRQFGTSHQDHPADAAPDGIGGIYVAGHTYGGLAGPSAGSPDAFVARYDFAGNQVWLKQFGTPDSDDAWAAAPDGANGLFVAGQTSGDLGGPNIGLEDGFVARYDSDGAQAWIRQFGFTGYDRAYGAAPDGSGGVCVVGITSGEVTGTNYYYDAYAARFGPDGAQLWLRLFGTTASDAATDAARDERGRAFVSGRTDGSLGGPGMGGSDAFLARLDDDGNVIWIRQLGSAADDYGSAIAPDGAAGVYVAGFTEGNLAGTVSGWDAFLARYDESGTQIWVRQFGTSNVDAAYAVATDGAGGVRVVGRTASDAYVARYSEDGIRSWILQFGTSGLDLGGAVVPDSMGGVFVAGRTWGGFSGPPTGGASDGFVARISAPCFPDCTGDLLLTPADFQCFQAQFVLGDPYADCTADGHLTVADFGCFQTRFVVGCR